MNHYQAEESNQSNPNQRIESYVLNFTKDDPQSFASYQKLIEPMFKLQAESIHAFDASTKVYMFKDLIFSTSQANTSQATLTRSHTNESATHSDYIQVFFYRDVPIQIQTIQGEIEVDPEQIVFAYLSQPLVIHTSSINVWSFNFSRTLLNKLIPINEGLHGVVFRDGPHQQLLLNYMKTLANNASEILAEDSVNVTETIMHLVANCVHQTKGNKIFSTISYQKLTLLKLKQAIDAKIQDPNLSVETLTQQFHTSRASIYRMFQPVGGVAKYIKNRKLDYAFTELARDADIKPNISELSNQLGFSHPAAFTRSFIEKFGINPSDVRARANKTAKQALPWSLDLDLDPFKSNK